MRIGLLVAVVATGLLAGTLVLADWWTALPDDAQAHYVGRETCAQCHQKQLAAWTGSHHDLAMDRATDETVLADFDNATVEHHGVVSRMFRRDGKFLVHTEGPDGTMADFEVKYVFGVEPLQQYMVEFDGEEPSDQEAGGERQAGGERKSTGDRGRAGEQGRAGDQRRAGEQDGSFEHEGIGRLQVLRLSWDTERKEWFYLPPPDVAEKLEPDDDLHWTGIAQRWNTMCAECHSTNVDKGYDPQTGRYHTTFSEIDVSCEACHGPGSLHVELARGRSLFWDRKRGYGLVRLKDENSETEIQSCAPCHSRRRPLAPDYRPEEDFFNYYATELLNEQTYHADGQILDEVYVHGSFLQSKMYHKGIRCTDCHDPHTTRLKHEGNRVCTSCHTHSAGKYDTPAHHQHKAGSTGASCVNCHMPSTTYMEVDPRRDHSLRIPRPDLSVQLGTPNACTGCHLRDNPLGVKPPESLGDYAAVLTARRAGDEQAAEALARLDTWSAEWVAKWYPERKERLPHYALALAAGRRGDEDAEERLTSVALNSDYPAIARATAVSLLAPFDNYATLKVAREAVRDEHPLVRAAAIQRLQRQDLEGLEKDLLPLLDDPSRLVRTEAARATARIPDSRLRSSERERREAALDEYIVSLRLNNDRAGAHLMLGNLFEELGRIEDAEEAYRLATRTERRATGPRTNLAALLERQAEQAEQRAAEAAQGGASAAASRHAEQAAQLRERAGKLRREELPLLARDARLAPDSGPVQYRYGLALYLDGQLEPAEAALRRAVELEPEIPDFQLALALLYQKLERHERAFQAAQRLLELRPRDPSYRQLYLELRQAVDQARPPSAP